MSPSGSATTGLLDALGGARVVLCAGPGGVGKTTSSAAVGLALAQAGKRVLVLTIDPARRLADALGLTLDDEPTRVPLAEGTTRGQLWGAMLDPAKTFDDMVRRLSPDAQAAERLLQNGVYKQISRALAGAVEYTAVERLYDLYERFDVDVIVVDTPPSKNVLDFLEAPQWLSHFLDEKVLRWFLLFDPQSSEGGVARRLLRRTAQVAWDVLGRIFGAAFLGDIVDFVRAIEGIAGEVSRRAQATQALLASPQSRFLVVATPDPQVLDDALYLYREIGRRGTHFAGFIVNKMQAASGVQDIQGAVHVLEGHWRGVGGAQTLAGKLGHWCRTVERAAQTQQQTIERLRQDAGWSGYVALVPRQDCEINDARALARLVPHLNRGPT